MDNIDSIIPLHNHTSAIILKEAFVSELTKRFSGQTSSLPCIIHPLFPPVMRDGSGITTVLGGTNGASAVWNIVNNKINFSHKRTFIIPEHITNQFIISCLQEHLTDVHTKEIGLNFAYRLAPKLRAGYLDGVLLSNAKESKFDQTLIQSCVGETFEAFLHASADNPVRIAVANDTICLLLAGAVVDQTQNKSIPVISGIVGTGINFAFYLPTQDITQIKDIENLTDWKGSHVAINTESGHFSYFPKTKWDDQLDEESKNPGLCLAEKQISGAYLYRLYNTIAASYNLPSIVNSGELDRLAMDTSMKGSKIAERILERSAQQTAIMLAGMLKIIAPSSESSSILMEGSIFWKGYKYKERVMSWLTTLVNTSVSFVKVDDSSLVGGAMLSLTIPQSI